MAGSSPETTQDRPQTKDTHQVPRQKRKFLTPPGIEPGTIMRAGTLRTRHGDGLISYSIYHSVIIKGNVSSRGASNSFFHFCVAITDQSAKV